MIEGESASISKGQLSGRVFKRCREAGSKMLNID
jgi:hypothetical protein